MRGSGLTKAMVEALPNEGGMLVVHSATMRRYVEQMIRDLRGVDIYRRCRVIVVNHHIDLGRLDGFRGYIDIDHALEWNVHPIVAAELKLIVRHIMSTRSPRTVTIGMAPA